MTNEIQVIPENEIAVAFQTFTAQELFERVKEQAMSVVFDVNDPKDQKALKSHVYKIRQSKTAFDLYGKELKEQYTQITSKIDAERKVFKNSCDELIEELLQPLVEIETKEQDRKKNHEKNIQDIINLGIFDDFQPYNSSHISRRVTALKQITVDSNFQEYESQAKLAKYETLESLEKMFLAQLEVEVKESEAKRIAEEQAEALRIQEEEAAKQRQVERDERLKREAVEKAEAEAKQRELRLEAEKEALKQKAIDDAAKAEEAKQQAIKDERERAEREHAKAESEKLARQEAERMAEEKRQANKAHQKRICAEILQSLIDLGQSEESAKMLINYIHSGKVAHVSINY